MLLESKWSIKYDVDDEAICGYYYKKYRRVDDSYKILKKSELVFMYAHLVRGVKFLMPPKDYCVSGNDMVYAIHDATRQGVKSIILLLEVD